MEFGVNNPSFVSSLSANQPLPVLFISSAIVRTRKLDRHFASLSCQQLLGSCVCKQVCMYIHKMDYDA